MAKCTDCGKEIPKDRIVWCDMCGASGLCSGCTELWEAEIDLGDMEAEEE